MKKRAFEEWAFDDFQKEQAIESVKELQTAFVDNLNDVSSHLELLTLIDSALKELLIRFGCYLTLSENNVSPSILSGIRPLLEQKAEGGGQEMSDGDDGGFFCFKCQKYIRICSCAHCQGVH